MKRRLNFPAGRRHKDDSVMMATIKDALSHAHKRKVSDRVILLLEQAVIEQGVDDGMALLKKKFTTDELARLDTDLKRLKLP